MVRRSQSWCAQVLQTGAIFGEDRKTQLRDFRPSFTQSGGAKISSLDRLPSGHKTYRDSRPRLSMTLRGLPVSLLHEFTDRFVSSRQCCLIWEKDDPEVFGPRLLAEPGAVHYHDVLLEN